MKKFFKITKNDQILGIILLVMSIISIVLGILIKYNYLQLSSDFFKNPDILSYLMNTSSGYFNKIPKSLYSIRTPGIFNLLITSIREIMINIIPKNRYKMNFE